jgi:hypothetical protein
MIPGGKIAVVDLFLTEEKLTPGNENLREHH